MNEESKNYANDIVDKVREAVKKGNVSRIIVRRNEEAFLNIPLNAGIAGTVLGLAAAPWAVLTAAIATVGFDCRIELVKTDGEVVELLSRDVSKKAVETGAAVVSDMKERISKD